MAWSKQSRHERGYGNVWDKLRLAIIARDRGMCKACLIGGRVTPYACVDHIRPKANGGTDDSDNLQCLCNPCHDAKTAAEAAQGRGVTLKPRPKFDGAGRVIW